jgi:hypothetical protein
LKTIHFIASNTDPIVDYLISPIRKNKRRLEDFGYKIRFFNKLSNEAISCDILSLVSKTLLPIFSENRPVLDSSGPVVSFLKNARESANKIIWFDSSDSTGVTHFELLPYLDLYLKKQLFTDKSLYKKPFYGGRIFSEFYHKKFNVEDTLLFTQFFPLEHKDFAKVQLSWNIGMGDMYHAFSKRSFVRKRIADYWPVNYDIPFVPVQKDRSINVFLSTSVNLNRPTIAFHRKEIVKRLKEIVQKGPGIKGIINGQRMSTRLFKQTMRSTSIMPSPFGWGEIGVRDYEAFIYGALLLKPDMTHLTTWPDIFKEGVTYQPFDWDFNNLESLIVELLESPKKRMEIAQHGQSEYKKSVSKQGMENFCNWFINQIER